MSVRTVTTTILLASLFLVIGIVASPSAEAADTVVKHSGLGTASPHLTTIKVGDQVTWMNDSRSDDIIVTASGPVPRPSTIAQDELAMNAVVRPGTTYTHRFKKPGIYYYFCTGDMRMWGKVIVKGA